MKWNKSSNSLLHFAIVSPLHGPLHLQTHTVFARTLSGLKTSLYVSKNIVYLHIPPSTQLPDTDDCSQDGPQSLRHHPEHYKEWLDHCSGRRPDRQLLQGEGKGRSASFCFSFSSCCSAPRLYKLNIATKINFHGVFSFCEGIIATLLTASLGTTPLTSP